MSSYTPHGFLDEELSDGSIKEGDWRRIVQGSAIQDLTRPRGRRQLYDGKHLQSVIKNYVNSDEGAVEWSDRTFHDCLGNIQNKHFNTKPSFKHVLYLQGIINLYYLKGQ